MDSTSTSLLGTAPVRNVTTNPNQTCTLYGVVRVQMCKYAILVQMLQHCPNIKSKVSPFNENNINFVKHYLKVTCSLVVNRKPPHEHNLKQKKHHDQEDRDIESGLPPIFLDRTRKMGNRSGTIFQSSSVGVSKPCVNMAVVLFPVHFPAVPILRVDITRRVVTGLMATVPVHKQEIGRGLYALLGERPVPHGVERAVAAAHSRAHQNVGHVAGSGHRVRVGSVRP